MPLGRQAKTLSRPQIEAVLNYLAGTRHPARNRVIFLLSVKAGLRAKEIASLTWGMVTEADGSVGKCIRLQDHATKGQSGRVIPTNDGLFEAIIELHRSSGWISQMPHVIRTERASKTSAQAIVNTFARWYGALGFQGCSSHSGRRTFITNAARKISTVGGSLRDIQMLAGHSNLRTTQRYIEADVEAQKRVVELV